MKSYTIKSMEDIAFEKDHTGLSLPHLVPDSAIIFHYHIYNVLPEEVVFTSPDELAVKCIWRVVFSTEHFSGMKDLHILWGEVLDEYHPYDKLYCEIKHWIPTEAIGCTSCGFIDTTFKMAPCKLCDAPLCKNCYEDTGYCDDHLN